MSAAKPAAPRRKQVAAKPDEHWELRLYVVGQTPCSLAAIANLRSLCETHLQGCYRVEAVNLLAHPQLSREDEILALPTLVRKLPPPLREVIGVLSETERVLVGLQLRPSHPTRS